MKRWRTALLLSSWLVACRGGDACEGTSCGNASGTCRSDEECDDGLACNGEETCEGRCVEGTPVECGEGLVCENRSRGAACEFPETSPWYVYVGDDLGKEPFGLFGVREADLGRSAPTELSAGVATEEYLAPTFHSWSPDGRFLVFDMMTDEFQSRLFFVEFGAGLPSPAAKIPDLPFSDGWSPNVFWSTGGEAAIVRENSDFYWLDFRAGAPVASPFAPKDAPTEVWPCADGESVVYETEDGTALVAAAASPEDAELLGEGNLILAPDGSRFAVFSPDRVWTAECGLGMARRMIEARSIEEPSPELGWSFDSRFLAYSLRDADEGPFELAVVDALTGAEPWRATHRGDARWDSKSARLLFVPENADEFAVATFPGGELRALGVPAGARNVRLHASGVSYGLSDENDEESAWLWLDGAAFTQRLDGCSEGIAIFDEGPSSVACVEESEAGSSFLAFERDNDGALSWTRLSAPVPATLYVHEFSPGGRGFIGSRSTSTDESSITLLWIAAPFEPRPAPVAINQGTIGYGSSWQPPVRSKRAGETDAR
jgi:hypothetical protein